MASPITILKNDELLFKAPNIQEAANFLSERLKITKSKLYDPIERGYVYNIPFNIEGSEYRFVASEEIAANRRMELEERGHKNARRMWLIPANPEEYDLATAFGRYKTLDWRRSFKYENGDILFIYVSSGVQKVRYKVEVVEGLVDADDVFHNPDLWQDAEKFERSKEWDYTRIRFVDEADTWELSLEQLRERGLKGNIQGAMKLKGELLEYITPFFEHDWTEGYYPDEVSERLEEGKRKSVIVNVYERNPMARKQCIEHYGVLCQICDMDFESKYGSVGKDFIHVHHVRPLHEVQDNYIVNPIEDLIPVCPNCHAMLHRKENGKFLSVEQLKARIME